MDGFFESVFIYFDDEMLCFDVDDYLSTKLNGKDKTTMINISPEDEKRDVFIVLE